MTNAPYMKCSNGLRAVGWTALVVYGIAGPLGLGWVVQRNMQSAIFAQFHGAFVSSAKYWELVLSLRRIVFLMMTLLVGFRSVFRTISQCVILVLSSILHLWSAPYARREENVCEMVSLGLLVLNGIASLSRRVETGVHPMPMAPEGTEQTLIVCFAMNALFVVYCVARIAFGENFTRGVRSLSRRLRGQSALEEKRKSSDLRRRLLP